MKKLYLILLMCITTSIFAQNSFPTSNAIWNYTVSASDWVSGNTGGKNIYYTICGDTIIGDNVCSKLYTTLDTIICGENLSEFLGCFRQNGQKVYFIPYYKAYSIYPAYFGEEFLLYDFGVSVGDTVHVNYGFHYNFWKINGSEAGYHNFMNNMGKALIVSDIAIENGIKKIVLKNEYDIWYEGMGSPFGLFNAGTVQSLDGYSFSFSLICFKYNDIVKYLNNFECNKCFCMNYINIQEKAIETINIFPNPTNGIFNIGIPGNINIMSVTIYSIDGKLIKKNIYSFHLNQLDISKLEASSYILNIETDKGDFNQIIIKN